jgi:hypothetical protein
MGYFRQQNPSLKLCQRITAHETIETIDDITRKNSPAIPTITDTDTYAEEE